MHENLAFDPLTATVGLISESALCQLRTSGYGAGKDSYFQNFHVIRLADNLTNYYDLQCTMTHSTYLQLYRSSRC